ncbi:unnamed protein product [Protopolystoma xenopodis]|uniref:Uncharacterized protein n=1 Tax=Protopolystoma xenopodis TaxID=117903 RepID=A0A448WDC5_9PLAT|nr:unnamed protein product [Protopolystoma xenopodis]
MEASYNRSIERLLASSSSSNSVGETGSRISDSLLQWLRRQTSIGASQHYPASPSSSFDSFGRLQALDSSTVHTHTSIPTKNAAIDIVTDRSFPSYADKVGSGREANTDVTLTASYWRGHESNQISCAEDNVFRAISEVMVQLSCSHSNPDVHSVLGPIELTSSFYRRPR